MPRMFVAVYPPDDVVERIRDLPRADGSTVRYSSSAQLHITLCFLPEVNAGAARIAFESIEPARATATLEPRVEVMFDRVIALPVSGCDDLAASVAVAFAPLGLDRRSFRGHLTLGRIRKGADTAVEPVGRGFSASFPVTSISLVESQLAAAGARHTIVAERELM